LNKLKIYPLFGKVEQNMDYFWVWIRLNDYSFCSTFPKSG